MVGVAITTRKFDSLGVETFKQHRNLDTLINLDVTELGRTDQLIKTMKIVELNQFLEQQRQQGIGLDPHHPGGATRAGSSTL